MDIRAVECLLSVAEHGSLRRAATALGITQPAVTKLVRRVEDEAGTRLFERTGRGVRPTVAGAVMLRHARNLQASLRASTVEIAALKAGWAGLVRIGAGPAWERAILPEAITGFLARRPSVRIEVLGGTDDALKQRLRDGELDFVLAAITEAPGLDADLDWVPLTSDEYCVIAGRGHKLAGQAGIPLATLLDYPWTLPGPQSLMVRRLHLAFRSHGLTPPETAIESDIVALRQHLLGSGHYLGCTAASGIAGLGIVRLDVPDAVSRRAAGVITRRNVEPGPAVAAMIETIAAVAVARPSGAGA